MDRACTRIQAALQIHGGSLRFTQIKEKYGTARPYWEGAISEETEQKVEEAIDLSEAASACTCEQCGKPGRLFNRGGWFVTACDKHGKGIPVTERRDFEQVRVVYSCRVELEQPDASAQGDVADTVDGDTTNNGGDSDAS